MRATRLNEAQLLEGKRNLVTQQRFVTPESSPNFNLKKYDFNLYKGFFMEKKRAQIHQIFMISTCR
jgi:exonuclease I